MSASQRKDDRAKNRELTYVLQLGDEDLQLLTRYRDVLVQGGARFAEVYYNYLFDNPATAQVLYDYERDGGDVSDLVRSQLQQLLSILDGVVDNDNAVVLRDIGKKHYERGVEPAWVLGAYRLYLHHLQQLVSDSPQIEVHHQHPLHTALVKIMFRALGIMLQAYWEAAVDVVEEARGEMAGRQSELDVLMDNLPQMLWSLDVASGKLLYASPALHNLCDGKPQSPVPCMERIKLEDRQRVMSAWERALQGQQEQVECRLDLGTEDRWFRLALYPQLQARGKVQRMDALLEDAADAHRALERLERMATTDELTGLANRHLWVDRVSQALAACRRAGDLSALVMQLGVDDFKSVNESLGREAGDALLGQIAERLRSGLRDSDTLARIGGAQFAVLLPAVVDPRRAGEQVAGKLLGKLRAPFLHGEQELYISSTIGMATFPADADDGETLMERADAAMYQARRSALPYGFHGDREDAVAQRPAASQLRDALARKEFELHYQPKVDVRSMKLSGAEALLRWKHPQDGLVMPERFLHVAEQSGLMAPITDWVLVTALRQSREWRERGVDLPITVNVSVRSFQSPHLLEKISAALQMAEVSGDCLEIDITEETLMTDLEHGTRVVRALTELGVRVAVDDFGTGQSSLACLRRLPIHTLKIDRSFLLAASPGGGDEAMLRSIIDLGHNLGLNVVAEGVEDGTAWELLSGMGCDEVQGYHVSRPLTQDGFSHWMTAAPWNGRH